MVQKLIILAVFITWYGVSFSQTDSLKSEKKWMRGTRLTALIDSRTAFEFGSSTFTKSELIVRPELEVPFSKNFRFTMIARAYSEFTDKLEPWRPEQNEVSDFSQRYLVGDRVEFELRDFYFDWKIKKKHYLTFGKQQIVWGEADGLKILDVVNPINLREFLLDDFEQSRIPLWSVKADISLKKTKLQLLWIPDQTYHDLPDPSGLFFPTGLFPAAPQGIQVNQEALAKPDRIILDSDFGARISRFYKGWDITLNYLYHYDDFPVASNQLSTGTLGESILTVSPTYRRYHLIGGTFNTTIKSFTLRGEAGYSVQRSFNTTDQNVENGIFKSDQMAGVVGLDFYGWSSTTIGAQIFADGVFENYVLIGRDQLELNLTFIFSRNFKNETITTDLVLVQNLNKGDGFIRPKIKWNAKSNLIFSVGADIIYGDQNRLFGQFKDRSRVLFGVQFGI